VVKEVSQEIEFELQKQKWIAVYAAIHFCL